MTIDIEKNTYREKISEESLDINFFLYVCEFQFEHKRHNLNSM